MKRKRSSVRPAVEIREYTVVPAKETFPLRRRMLRRIVAALNQRSKSSLQKP